MSTPVSTPGERHARRAAAAAAPPPPRAPAPRPRRALRRLSTALIVVGGLVATDAATTLLWQEPVSHVLTQRRQAVLAGELRALRGAPLPRGQRAALAALRGQRERIAFLARGLARSTPAGGAVGELRLPRLDQRVVVVKGTDDASLRKGPGAYTGIGLPGVPGTAAIAGHRTTYGAPFRHLDALRRGDAVVLAMPYATFTYRVERTRVVEPSDTSVLARRRYDRLVLSACTPLFSAARRIVVLARLEGTVPAGVLSAAA